MKLSNNNDNDNDLELQKCICHPYRNWSFWDCTLTPKDVDKHAGNTWDHCIAPESLFVGNS